MSGEDCCGETLEVDDLQLSPTRLREIKMQRCIFVPVRELLSMQSIAENTI